MIKMIIKVIKYFKVIPKLSFIIIYSLQFEYQVLSVNFQLYFFIEM